MPSFARRSEATGLAALPRITAPPVLVTESEEEGEPPMASVGVPPCAIAPPPVRLMLETYRTGPEGFGYERGIFQDLCPDPDAFVRQGLAFLTGCCS